MLQKSQILDFHPPILISQALAELVLWLFPVLVIIMLMTCLHNYKHVGIHLLMCNKHQKNRLY